jgi:hypothetical protein
MTSSLRTDWMRTLLWALLACACEGGTGDDTPKTDSSGLTGSRPAAAEAASGTADTCTAAGGECLPQGSSECAHFGLTELECGSGGPTNGDWCCLDRFFAACDQGQTFPIVASDYDQSCEKNSDCIGIGEGDGCGCGTSCPNAAINVADQPKWLAQLAQTPAATASIVCNCPAFFGVDCVDHRCVARRP